MLFWPLQKLAHGPNMLPSPESNCVSRHSIFFRPKGFSATKHVPPALSDLKMAHGRERAVFYVGISPPSFVFENGGYSVLLPHSYPRGFYVSFFSAGQLF